MAMLSRRHCRHHRYLPGCSPGRCVGHARRAIPKARVGWLSTDEAAQRRLVSATAACSGWVAWEAHNRKCIGFFRADTVKFTRHCHGRRGGQVYKWEVNCRTRCRAASAASGRASHRRVADRRCRPAGPASRDGRGSLARRGRVAALKAVAPVPWHVRGPVRLAVERGGTPSKTTCADAAARPRSAGSPLRG